MRKIGTVRDLTKEAFNGADVKFHFITNTGETSSNWWYITKSKIGLVKKSNCSTDFVVPIWETNYEEYLKVCLDALKREIQIDANESSIVELIV